jgi:SSS family solute:Na+ symporter
MVLTLYDYLIIAAYFLFVLGIGYYLKTSIKSSEDFFLSGRSISAWITGLAFVAANCGALEVMGMVSTSAKYGMLTVHFYWIAMPAMAFIGVFMMPFYYGSRVRSVPEFLKRRFDEKTRTFNALSFAAMTLLVSGINMYAMGVLFRVLLGWSFDFSVLLSAGIVLAYVFFGGLTSSIYNEVIQFLLIVFGLFPLTYLGLRDVGGWEKLVSRLPENFTRVWGSLGSAQSNPMGVEWFGVVFGLGFVLGFGYWCTDFLVVQRALASKDLNSAQRTPLIAAFPKIVFPIFVVLPGLIAIAVLPQFGDAARSFLSTGHLSSAVNFDMALPLMMKKYLPTGLLGLGLTALLASFMSGMAGNVTAFNTVWTFDIYQTHIRPGRADRHYVRVGKLATVFGVLASIGLTYLAKSFNNIMDYIQLLFSFFNAPLFATFLLGMFWKRATSSGAFWGLVSGTASAAAHYFLVYRTGLVGYGSEMSANFYGAIVSWLTCFVLTIVMSLMTEPKDEKELVGLVYSLTPRTDQSGFPLYRRPWFLAVIAISLSAILYIIFW